MTFDDTGLGLGSGKPAAQNDGGTSSQGHAPS